VIGAIDPGVDACAYAWGSGALQGVSFAAPENPAHVSSVLVERPEYQGARSDASRTQDLIALAWAGARAAYELAGESGCLVREVTPHEWKGSVPKPVHHVRLWAVLAPAERALFPADTAERISKAADKCALKPGAPGASYYGRGKGSEVHNLLDAAALLMWYFGRLK
jgi:hypothetical protein